MFAPRRAPGEILHSPSREECLNFSPWAGGCSEGWRLHFIKKLMHTSRAAGTCTTLPRERHGLLGLSAVGRLCCPGPCQGAVHKPSGKTFQDGGSPGLPAGRPVSIPCVQPGGGKPRNKSRGWHGMAPALAVVPGTAEMQLVTGSCDSTTATDKNKQKSFMADTNPTDSFL